ncbi:MAG TPA: DUF1549 domain-containing protein, partial [Planctomycetota bacterium]|nr:DUF1549 domain-containing protein [Planctomycetota bacterium]
MALLGLATLTARSDEPAPTPSRPEVVGAASARASAEIAGGPTSESSAPASENVSGVAADSSRALWETHVRDLLRERCARCHGAPVRKSRLDLTSPESILAGGRRGAAVVPGDPDSSLLVRFVAADAEKRMPPEGDPLSDEEIALLRRWVERLDPEAVTQREADRSLEAAATREASPATPLPPPGSVRPRVVIDLLIESAWAERGIEPAAVSSDETFVRRIYLDLVGRIPTIAERERFLGDVDSLKRERLADELLLSDEWAVRMREMLDVVLLGRGGERARRERAQHGWHDFLERSIRENRPWSEIARDIILARSGDARSAGASWFAFEHRNDHQAIAERLAPAILGARVQCAQCHDHPIAPEIEQRHYWGLVAFYGRSKNVSTPGGPAIAESAVGGYVQFADLDGKSHPAIPIFLDGRAAAEEWPEGDEKPAEDASLYTVPPAAEGEPARESVPTYSRRAELARLVTSSERLDQ